MNYFRLNLKFKMNSEAAPVRGELAQHWILVKFCRLLKVQRSAVAGWSLGSSATRCQTNTEAIVLGCSWCEGLWVGEGSLTCDRLVAPESQPPAGACPPELRPVLSAASASPPDQTKTTSEARRLQKRPSKHTHV